MQESRLFRIIYHLLEKGGATAPELAEQFEVSIRTIYRDIDSLSSAGIPIYASAGRNGGIRLCENYILKQSLLSELEQQDILAAVGNMAALSNQSDPAVMTKLGALFQSDIQKWIDIDFTQWGAYSNEIDKFELLKTAILKHNMVQFQYVSAKGLLTMRTAKPVKLIHKAAAWYLQAFCLEKEDFRIFKVNRIHDLSFTDETFEAIAAPVITSAKPPAIVNLVLCFSEKIAYRIYDEFDLNCIEKAENGSLLVTVSMPDEEWLIRYLMSFGANIKILEPAAIRQRFFDETRKMLDLNQIF